ncbi:anhydro-N-acetylmuramic acid kinase [Brevirhabdus pacifica]|uniref:Anhydro-N-acetylmuramic acid kinase n=2 Tax=Brevirhabdus pacifica TaxID=1267768 RepID=A0A1U7DEL7_9RHOB|nr:anhydro-N-acetylmuramic acid kinase [Brevirhabdus pacifica]APX88396.1 anhydro-N-acetylmuramic acid kinase [Brevirhabdus pacifica]PJJ87146.1 anhydro-N-acetylmuramic acid kinase [Brevirhabdus pacifica]
MLKQGPVWALGTMSGTSLDGVDAAMLRTDGEEILEFGESAYLERGEADRRRIAAAFGRWPGEPGVEAVAELIETEHARLLSRFEGYELVGFHGQTLAHEPRGRGTHQAGDGQVLAEVLGQPVVWDFRSSDVELGGEGAPLAPFFHHACARWIGAEGPLAFLNLGGVGNLTWVDPRPGSPLAEGAILAFDTGPANAPLNDLVQARLGQGYDAGGALAATGVIDEEIVARFLRHPFFFKRPPKSLDRNDFPDLARWLDGLDDGDAAATLCAVAAASVAVGLEHCPEAPGEILVTGGGRHHPVMMSELSRRCGCPVRPVEAVGLDGDMLEAQAFAYLAVRVARGLPTSCRATTGVAAAVGGGRISRPDGVQLAGDRPGLGRPVTSGGDI